MTKRYVYYFGNGEADGGQEDKELLGGKGANLAEMTRIGVPVPPGFTITTEASVEYMRTGALPEEVRAEAEQSLRRIERETGKSFGGTDGMPLLVSVRSGAAVSMPGMMDTILNLGLNDDTVVALAEAAGDERFAYDSYRRFIQMYGDVVQGIPMEWFERELKALKQERGVEHDTGLDAEDLKGLVARFKEMVRSETGTPFPQDPQEQLWGAVRAVFDSWDNERAIAYRRSQGIPDDLGTAVNVQTMVYGNTGDDSGTGVAFTRDPSTGENRFFGEFLVNAQGEDVVAGIRDPMAIEEMESRLPGAYQELLEVHKTLEQHYRDMQDLEFTVERGTLYLLQTRTGKRTAAAAIRIAVEVVDEGLIDRETAVGRVDPGQLDQLLHPRLDPDAEVEELATGLPASPGAASGQVVFDPAEATRRGEAGEAVVLIREETSPDDFAGMVAARAIVTSRGGMTSHAAVVARGIGKSCVVGAREIWIGDGFFEARGERIDEGDWVTIDGGTGRILKGRVPTVEPELSDDFRRLMAWADDARDMGVRANADTPADAAKAREFGAEGIGLCRTEHMFFEGDRIRVMREMILAADEDARRRALARLLPIQREDFAGIFRAMDGYPVTVRLLDPPLHEFLPQSAAEDRELAEARGLSAEEVKATVMHHREANPMLGHRGVRLGISYPEITEMQARAILEAAIDVAEDGVDVRPEIMIPLVSDVKELRHQARRVHETARKVFEERGREIEYMVGTMIELPRAALTAGDIAAEADFFSFGTNDLTQTTFGISRDDAGSFLPRYLQEGMLEADPFQVLDRSGVGRLVALATADGRRAKQSLKVGICGEHGGDPDSVHFFHSVGLDYVSCSPFRVPVARLAAAQAAVARAARDPDPAGDPPERELQPVA